MFLAHYAHYNALRNEYDALNTLNSVLMNITNIVLGTVMVLCRYEITTTTES